MTAGQVGFTILGMAIVTFVPRLLGFVIAERRLAPFWTRALRFVPIAVFAALVTPSLPGAGGLPARIAAAVVAALAMWRTRRLELGLVAGLATFALLRWWALAL